MAPPATIEAVGFLADPNYWAGVATALLAVGVPVLAKRFTCSAATPDPDVASPESLPSTDLVDNWEADRWMLPSHSSDERRRQSRRPGNPVPVLFKSDGAGEQQAFVTDRSRGGLRLSTAKSIPVGATIQVRTSNAPAGTPCVEAMVRWCSKAGTGYQAGCQFVQIPPWNVLLLFG